MPCLFIIFASHWIIISCNEMLPVAKLTNPKGVDGDPSSASEDTKRLRMQKLTDMKTDRGQFDEEDVLRLEADLPTPDGEDTDDDPISEGSPKSCNQFPTGRLLHSELFLNKSAVHLPPPDLLHSEHCRLRVTADYMQTAVDAFAIIHEGTMADVRALPADYVLRSARTIAMMKLPQEKLSAMWYVVLNGRNPNTITYQTLELYRPLFKYLSGIEMAKLNLTDARVVNYIGTHPDLTRHQVGVVASKYIKVNKNWNRISSLNNMNNLLCGVPMTFMRKLDAREFLRLEHQVFYHIRACDPLQKRFYLNMMTRTQALGKSFSWSTRDVSRLGLLLAEVEGTALAAISPEAMAGISFHVMAEMKAENLKHLTDLQIKHIKRKSRNIMSRKLKEYDIAMLDSAYTVANNMFLISLLCCGFTVL